MFIIVFDRIFELLVTIIELLPKMSGKSVEDPGLLGFGDFCFIMFFSVLLDETGIAQETYK